MKTIFLTVGFIIVLGIGAVLLNAHPQQNLHGRPAVSSPKAVAAVISTPTASPSLITVNTPTTVTVTVSITGATPLSNGINLLRLGATGTQPTILGVMHDDGNAGDAVAGDHIFSTLVRLQEDYPGPLTLEVSAPFTGLLRRVTSPPLTITVQGVTFPTFLSDTPFVVQGTITSSTSYVSGLYILTDFTISVTRTIKGSPLPSNIVVSTLGGAVGTQSQLPPFGQPFALNQQVLLFLDVGVDGKSAIGSGSLGVFRLQQDIHGNTVAIVDSGFSTQEVSSPLDPTYLALLSQSSAGLLSLDALLAAISANQ
jgi:hypothetical protein